MPIGRWFLPKSVNARLAAFLNDLGKAHRLSFEKLHNSAANGAPGGCAYAKSPPENYGKEDQTTVAAFLPWRDS